MKFNRNYTERYLIEIEKQNIIKVMIIVLLFAVTQLSCKKLIEIPPPASSLNSLNVYSNNVTAAAVMTGLYTNMSLDEMGGIATRGISSLYLIGGLSADELTLFNINNTTILPFYTNKLVATASVANYFWGPTYTNLYTINEAIEKLNSSDKLTPAVKQQLTGEALFMRAFYYFYLVNLYGDVPLIMSTDYKNNALLGRAPKAQVWQQIIADLTQAQEILSTTYLDATLLKTTAERVRPTKWAATALLARSYLYYGNLTGDVSNYAKAEAQASLIIDNVTQFKLQPQGSLNSVFLKNSIEAIWQTQPVTGGVNANTGAGAIFVLPATGPNTSTANPQYPVYLNTNLLNSFEAGDQRRTAWVNSVVASGITYNYANKYKIGYVAAAVSEYPTVFRVGEQYLIRAEARAQQGNVTAAAADLNTIRARAGLGATTAATQPTLRTAILQERQVELFTEWGHRWLDLKRTGTVDAVMNVVCPQKGGVWNTNWQYYPIPAADIAASNLLQNSGY